MQSTLLERRQCAPAMLKTEGCAAASSNRPSPELAKIGFTEYKE
ncbi:MAG: hypothetical protein QOF94_1611 [Acidobacteriaceae bacterium]